MGARRQTLAQKQRMATSQGDVTYTENGERGTGNREPGTGVWEQVYSGNPLENSIWRSKQRKRLEEEQFRLR